MQHAFKTTTQNLADT